MSKDKADLINKIFIWIGALFELAGGICLGFNVYEFGTVDTSIVLGLTAFGMWLLVSSVFIYAERHDIDITFSIPVHIVNKED